VIISDKDQNSTDGSGKAWTAVLKFGILKRNGKSYSVSWEKDEILKSKLNAGGRGMELSELVFFDGKLLTCDDRTGIIYEILTESKKVLPLHILTVGDGTIDTPLKCEWMTVVDDLLYVGSFGKEFVFEGQITDTAAQWIKIIDRAGNITHQNWTDKYEVLRELSGTKFPGYLLHEAIMWYPDKNQWVVLPRRFSTDPYDEVVDSLKGSNIIFIASQDFTSITINTIGENDPKKGTSSFKFIPYQNGDILQLKTIETQDQVETYISVVNIYTREVLMDDKYIDSVKFGVEFI
jgi:soluble calcium-activated nucleotidase 1